MKRIRFALSKWVLTLIAFSGLFWLAGCQSQIDISRIFDQLLAQIVGPAAVTSTPQATSQSTEQVSDPVITPTLPPISGTIELTIWVPPQFDPSLDTPQAALLKKQIADFEAEHDDVFITTRVKAVSGANGLLESLSVTNSAASQSMPSLVALSRSDLETAVDKNLVHSFDSYSGEIDQADWYPYAKEMGTKEGDTFGLPFAGDAFVLVYRDTGSAPPPGNWNELLRRGEPVSFPAADPQALMTFGMYLSNEGDLGSTQRLPKLDVEKLTQIYQTYADGASAGVFPLWLTQFQKDADAWTSYNELRSNNVITWLSRFLSESSEDSRLAVFPGYTETSISLADGWVWSLTDPRPETHKLIVELAEFLVDPDYLTEWTAKAGYLPVRPSSLSGFSDQTLQITIDQIAGSAQLRPGNEVINSIGLVMQEQVIQVLSLKTTAPFAAQAILERTGSQ